MYPEPWKILSFVVLAIGIALLLRRPRMSMWNVVGLALVAIYFAAAAVIGPEINKDLFVAAGLFAAMALRDWLMMRRKIV